MRYLLILLLVIVVFTSETKAHEIKLGLFEIYKVDSEVFLDIRLDKHDFILAIQQQLEQEQIVFYQECLPDHIQYYVHSNLQFETKGIDVYPKEEKIHIDEEFISVKASLGIATDKMALSEGIKVRNSCLVEEIEGHENIMRFDLSNRNRSFRMDKNRTQTKVSY